ncbi:transporter substrate-binding domain-containing protein [Chenggangzhangella methanolivorans]|uniref:Transporter substrate-binding domain-containing protein n=1 Tax=Chenggangzhangella methanolivorans TaxID=1437009 RepID=A0A9E6RE37_9HYPH|nr:transporter substrate-binding domain-containing protein [Chenggangzhangella methanolivorans]QZN99465.1 transporter substrate-binding domain-containing protein [Chenggangzhangella methanolivorans]
MAATGGLLPKRHARRRLVSAALVIVFALVGQAEASEWKKVRIATEGAYPPFNFIASDGSLQGFEIDLAKAICAVQNLDCSFVAQDWEGLIPGLLASKFDAVFASMSITQERLKVVAFSQKYYSSPAMFAVDSLNAGMDVSPNAMAGKVVGAQAATVSARYLEAVYGPAGAEVKLYSAQDEANLDLVSGRLDAMLCDKLVLLPWLETTDEGKCCRATGGDISDPEYFGDGVGAAIRKGDVALKGLIDDGVAKLRANGDYARINARYFPFSLY